MLHKSSHSDSCPAPVESSLYITRSLLFADHLMNYKIFFKNIARINVQCIRQFSSAQHPDHTSSAIHPVVDWFALFVVSYDTDHPQVEKECITYY